MKEQLLSTPGMQQTGTQKARSGEVVLRTHHLVKRYGERLAVNNLNLEVHQGDIFGFLGPNGAGKTTTIRMILGLITPTEGNITILGHDLAHSRARILPRVGALIETPALYLNMSGRDNLRAVGAVLGGVPQKRIDEVLSLVGLGARQRDRVRTYSLGMKQRLGIAIALLQDPEVVILDEPANGLDPAGIVEMRDLMHQLSDEGKSVLISSHLLTEVQQICTRIAIIAQGSLVTETTIDDLIRGEGEFIIQVERVQDALALVQQQPWGRLARIDDHGALITVAPAQNGRDLNIFLSKAGFVPETLTPAKQDLEQIFLQLTNSGSREVQ